MPAAIREHLIQTFPHYSHPCPSGERKTIILLALPQQPHNTRPQPNGNNVACIKKSGLTNSKSKLQPVQSGCKRQQERSKQRRHTSTMPSRNKNQPTLVTTMDRRSQRSCRRKAAHIKQTAASASTPFSATFRSKAGDRPLGSCSDIVSWLCCML